MTKDFIEIYKKYAPDEYCNKVIDLFERTIKGKDDESLYLCNNQFRKDYQIALDKIEHDLILTKETNSILDRASMEYRNKYITSLGDFTYTSWRIKLQKTPIGGGYHIWHSESAGKDYNRILVWTIFLNDMPEGEGETEFINYPKKIRPSKGDVLVFPAYFTHTHRGNPPLTTEKYIATGWWHLTT